MKKQLALLLALVLSGVASATTATGDFAIDWSAAGNADPYTNGSITLVDTGFNVKVLSNVLRPSNGGSGQFGVRRLRYNGTMTASATIRSKIEIANAGAGDSILATIIASDGSGYFLECNQTAVSIRSVNAGGTSSGLVSGTAATMASGDVVMLELVQTTHVLTAYLNGSQIGAVSVTDSTYTTGLAPGYGFDAENSSASTIRSWAGDGITIGGSTEPARSMHYKRLSQAANDDVFQLRASR